MAPRTRAAAAAEAASKSWLTELSHDEQSIVTHELCDPLRPLLAVHLSSTAKGLWVPMQEQLAELRQRHAEAAAFAAAIGHTCAELADATMLWLGRHRPLTLAHWRALGMLVGCGSLPRLERLAIYQHGEEGVASLVDGLSLGRLPSLLELDLGGAQIGPEQAAALASALTKRALPSLDRLSLTSNPLGDAGLAALLLALRRLPPLKGLGLSITNIGDEGVASLLAQPTAGALKSLEELFLNSNQITDAGCAALTSALRGGALPALRNLSLVSNPASEDAKRTAVHAALRLVVGAQVELKGIQSRPELNGMQGRILSVQGTNFVVRVAAGAEGSKPRHVHGLKVKNLRLMEPRGTTRVTSILN